MPQVVIANRLRDGVVVFLGREDRWCEQLADCQPLDTDEEAAKVLETGQQAERNQEIVDPQLIEVRIDDGVPVPVKRREAIRAKGPTIRTDLGKQAEE